MARRRRLGNPRWYPSITHVHGLGYSFVEIHEKTIGLAFLPVALRHRPLNFFFIREERRFVRKDVRTSRPGGGRCFQAREGLRARKQYSGVKIPT